MSGPVQTPLKVTEADGSPSGRPITEVIVSSGDLSISGVVATVDTTGATTSPATPADAIQFNSDPAGTFTASSDLTYTDTPHAGTDTLISANGAYLGNLFVGQNGEGTGNQQIESSEDAGIITISPRTTGEVYIQNDNAAGDLTDFDGRLSIIHGSTSGNAATLRLRNLGLDNYAQFYMGNNDLTISVIDTAAANAGIDIQTDGTGVVSIKNDETNGDSELVVFANGTGTPIVKLENGSMAVQTICEANKKFTIEGGAGGDTFVFDVSSATGGIQFPDSTIQTTAASGGGATFNPVLPPVVGSADRHRIALAAPYGGTALTVSATFADFQTCRGYPFIAPTSGDVTEIGIVVGTLTTSADCLVGIYSDNTGVPGSLMGFADIEMGATGSIYQTSISATVTLVAQTQYWFVVGGDDTITSGALTSLDDDYTCDIGLGWSPSGKRFCITHNASVTSLPATFVPTSIHATPRPLATLKIG